MTTPIILRFNSSEQNITKVPIPKATSFKAPISYDGRIITDSPRSLKSLIDQNEPFSVTSDDYKFEIRKGPQICDMNKIIKSEVFICTLHTTYYHIIT